MTEQTTQESVSEEEYKAFMDDLLLLSMRHQIWIASDYEGAKALKRAAANGYDSWLDSFGEVCVSGPKVDGKRI